MLCDARSGDGQPLDGAVSAGRLARAPLDVPLEAKLHAPGLRQEWVDRPGLQHLLSGATAKFVLVAAPAGSGKTTLVAQWRASSADGQRFAWVALDRGDDDPDRLWWYVVAALHRACPEIRTGEILPQLRVPNADLTATVLPVLANELAIMPEPVVLVLDDYHLIKERRCHDQVMFLLSHLPATVRLVIITRADPPLPLARLRASGEMAEIRQQELRFTPAQAASLVRAVSAAQLSAADLADLIERTEGWAAGVYLAGLSLRGHPSPHDFIRQFTGDHRFIVDFLGEEVLSRQPGELQQFLTRTSILSRFCAPLCEAVTGSGPAAGHIEALERENLFVVPLDDNRQWYRYHHLFGQLLRSRLARTEPGIEAELHRRASEWHRLAGTMEEAITHALAAGDTGGAADLITRNWFAYVDAGRAAAVRGWLLSVGEDRITGSPLLAHCAAWVAALCGDQHALRRWLPVVEKGDHQGPLPDGIRSLRSSAALLRGVYGFEGLRVMREAAATACELENDPASPWYAAARASLGFSRYLSGDAAAAVAPLREAVQTESSIPLIHMLALSVLSLVLVDLGNLPVAEELANAARADAARDDLAATPQTALAHTAAGAAALARGYPGKALGELEHALQSRRKVFGISPWPTVVAALLLARARCDLGDREGAAEAAGEARELLSVLPDGTQALRDRLSELERRLAGDARVSSMDEPLTDREAAVLRLLAGTLSLREIGQEMFVSANTVKTHTQRIYRKLGVSSRNDAVVLARQRGLL